MKPTRAARRLEVDLETRRCRMSRGEIEAMEQGLDALSDLWPAGRAAHLQIVVSYSEKLAEYHVKAQCDFAGRSVITGADDTLSLPAYERCLRKLRNRILWSRIGEANGKVGPDRIAPELGPFNNSALLKRLQDAFNYHDYPGFRNALGHFVPELQSRIRCWADRHAELIATDLPLDEMVEEVCVNAYDRFQTRPKAFAMIDWLVGLVGPSMRMLLRHPDEECDPKGYLRTLKEWPQGHDPAGPSARRLRATKPR